MVSAAAGGSVLCAFDLPRESPRVTSDAIDWWIKRENPTEAPSVKLSKASRSSDLDDDARNRIMQAEAVRKLYETESGQAVKDARLCGLSYRVKPLNHAGAAELFELDHMRARQDVFIGPAGTHRLQDVEKAESSLEQVHPIRSESLRSGFDSASAGIPVDGAELDQGPAGEITRVAVEGDRLTVEGRWARFDGDLVVDPDQPLVDGELVARCPETDDEDDTA